ncbi:Uncharacterized protein JA1_003608 [Spathaspora sp. JA1]|nr:Uncharacterized protein JA1_003608 [Spathaspora sp. JA1]
MTNSKDSFVYYRDKEYSIKDLNEKFPSLHLNQTKSLILCLDGTENEFGPKPFTNVLKLFAMLEKDNNDQLCYYQPGIGTSFQSESKDLRETNFISSNITRFVNQVDSMVAFTVKVHVIAAYEFLCKFYNKGDKIYLFGFSRGSFTARIVAGMIEKVGLINKGLENMIPMAWNIYANWEKAGQPYENMTVTFAQEFKKTFSRNDIRIHFMGLWDSINSVGVLRDQMFPYAIRSSNVDHIRHAVSIDERRSKFKQQLFYSPNEESDFNSSIESTSTSDNSYSSLKSISDLLLYLLGRNPHRSLREPPQPNNDLVQVFFPGNHGDIGGGWEPNDGNQLLSNVSLRWMLAQAIKFNVIFKPKSIGTFATTFPSYMGFLSYNHDVLTILPRYPDSLPTTTEITYSASASVADSVESVKYPHLPTAPIERFVGRGSSTFIDALFWWVLELLPISYKIEDQYGQRKQVFKPNLGHHRILPTDCVLHWSVFYRLHYVSDYNPENLPPEIGEKFLQSLSQFQIFNFNLIKDYSEGLTIDKIKQDWDSQIWKVIPDELTALLQDNPDL